MGLDITSSKNNQIGGAKLGASKELPDNLELNMRPQNSGIFDCSNEIWEPRLLLPAAS